MSIIDEIRETQAKTIAKHEEQLRRDKNVVLWVVHGIHLKIKNRMTNYYYAKDMTSMTFTFERVDMINNDRYKIRKLFDTDLTEKDVELTAPEYSAVVNTLLSEGFKISQREEYENNIRPVRKLTVEW